MACCAGPHGEAPDSAARQREQEKVWAKAFIGVSMGKARQGRVINSELASVNNFGGLWAMDVAPSCLAPAPGMIQEEEYCLLGCTSQIEEV